MQQQSENTDESDSSDGDRKLPAVAAQNKRRVMALLMGGGGEHSLQAYQIRRACILQLADRIFDERERQEMHAEAHRLSALHKANAAAKKKAKAAASSKAAAATSSSSHKKKRSRRS